jgi:hypothetical protein
MTDPIRFIEDKELRKVAHEHDLDSWEWGTEHPLTKSLMIEGAAIAIQSLFLENTKAEVFVNQNGDMTLIIGNMPSIKLTKKQEVPVTDDAQRVFGAEKNPIVKQYEAKIDYYVGWSEK